MTDRFFRGNSIVGIFFAWGMIAVKMRREEELAEEVLIYFQANPDAGDTLGGIADYWLGQKDSTWTIGELAETLDLLVRKGELRIVRTQSSANVYKIKK